jgi:2-desacetyl-2-hydroxyethyl bacteriochlorophyllide A dehydrogenase
MTSTGVGKMKAVWLEDNKLSYREDVPVPEPMADEALVSVSRAGICGTDLQLLKGYYPFSGIPGHEFVGKIVQAPGQPKREGQRVVGEINISCGACPPCLAGRKTHCEKRSVLGIKNRDGAFAEYVCLPLINLIAVPDTVSDDAAVFVEPLAAALEIQAQIPVGTKDHVLILGAGRLGQLIAQSLVPTGATLEVVARYEKQQKLLAQNNIQIIHEHAISNSAFDIVIEATGSPEGFSLAQMAVRPRGTIVLKSTYKGDAQINLSSIVVDEISLVGSRCGPFAPALALLESGLVDPAGLIEARYPLDDALNAFDHTAQPGTLKVILEMG